MNTLDWFNMERRKRDEADRNDYWTRINKQKAEEKQYDADTKWCNEQYEKMRTAERKRKEYAIWMKEEEKRKAKEYKLLLKEEAKAKRDIKKKEVAEKKAYYKQSRQGIKITITF